MASVIPYVGRTIDMTAFQGWELGIGVEALLSQELATPDVSGAVITGTIKLVQRFLLILLTEAGSMAYLSGPTVAPGCGFMTDARSGSWRTAADVQQSFYSALLDIKRQLLQLQTADDPLDEQFAGATILGVVLSPVDHAVLRLSLTSQAGTQRAFIAPLNIVA